MDAFLISAEENWESGVSQYEGHSSTNMHNIYMQKVDASSFDIICILKLA
jgi:hypothetical protein